MHRSLALLLIPLSLTLAACTTQPAPEERPYSEAEIKQFALELLSRSGLPYEDYEKIRRALLKPSQRMSRASEEIDAPPRRDAERG